MEMAETEEGKAAECARFSVLHLLISTRRSL
jgi:hypothetical protein